MAEVGPGDVEDAAGWWRENAPEKWRGLIGAEDEDQDQDTDA